MLLTKSKLDTFKVLIFKALIDSYVNHDKFDSENNVLREYLEMEGETKNPKTAVEYTI